ncbi:hypothetical protein [Dethiosulfatarculus sandiegensis]|nr:hypothetical protein [Dethiosulfatarculus sandiegensis]
MSIPMFMSINIPTGRRHTRTNILIPTSMNTPTNTATHIHTVVQKRSMITIIPVSTALMITTILRILQKFMSITIKN